MAGPFNKDNMGEETRNYVAANCKEGVTPDSAIEDWGDYNEDYSDTEHSEASGHGGGTDEHGTTYSSSDSVQTYYDSLRREDIRLL